ncbi:MAG: KpsF/GutQ family sugar-phosphate isomerase [Deltaproteobacteria bacterium]|nr:KpsF/GutQ family sugar-phosphate isomerase [Deltaproteobacteria bacterium]
MSDDVAKKNAPKTERTGSGGKAVPREGKNPASDKILESARKVLRIETEALEALPARLDGEFVRAVEMILACRGRVVVSGMGKSGLVGHKIAATLASTGTPAFFMHPAEGIHGDLGMLMRGDVVLAISYSGATEEVLHILPVIKRMGLPLIVMSGKPDSELAKQGDAFISIEVEKEACPLGLAPTASTTATLALGDALAIALLQRRGFKEEDFAFLHPGGSLGKRLLALVADFMHQGREIPLVKEKTPLKVTLFEITSKQLGITGVTNEAGELIGVFSDGDLRRALEKGFDILNHPVSEVMTHNPKRILRTNLAAAALRLMEKHSITSLFVFDSKESRVPVGIIHIHDLIKAGVV